MNPSMTGSSEGGFSLIETSIALAISGLLTIALVSYWKYAAHHQTTMIERSALTVADQSLKGFSQARFRLPCPDTDNDGNEDCGGATNSVGTLPWETLGIADSRVRGLRYGVYRKSSVANPSTDADLASNIDRFKPLLTTLPSPPHYPVTLESSLGNSNLIDFCTALMNGANDTFHSDRLHTVARDIHGTEISGSGQNVAYALAAPGLLDTDGGGNRFDGAQSVQTSSNPVFDSPSRPHSTNYDDQIRVAGFDQLFSTLSCGPNLVAIGHAQFNAATSAAVMQQYMYDHKKQLELSAETASAGVASATGTVLASIGGLLSATAVTATAITIGLGSLGTLSYTIAAGVASIVANVGPIASGAASLAAAVVTKTMTDNQVISFTNTVLKDATALAADIRNNALAADATGF
ncbi:MAG: hypothetical protein KBD39_09275 [Sterolibacterium sp.]|nr:hypothetical protein [Sterolibacterium sp.]MBP9800294.1 hypothetical protein [Sterolibacterium sp.]